MQTLDPECAFLERKEAFYQSFLVKMSKNCIHTVPLDFENKHFHGALRLTKALTPWEMFSGHTMGDSFLCRTFPRVTEHLCCQSQSTRGNVQAF